MNLETAPTVEHEPVVCTLCSEASFVIYENDKVCPDCGYLAGTGGSGEPDHPWFRWRTIRNELFEKEDGGNDRRKVVGSYVHAYTDGEGNIVI